MSTAPGSVAVKHEAADSQVHSVTFVAYPKLLFTWPLILVGYLFAIFAPVVTNDADSAKYAQTLTTLGWVYITVFVIVLLTLGLDVGRNQALFWGVLIFALWILGMYLRDASNIPVFGWIWNFFTGMNVRYDRGFGLAVSVILSIPFVIMIIVAWLNDRWRITHNEFEHYSFGKMDDSLGRGAKTIRSEYPDVFELLLGCAGTLIVFNASGDKELRRIPHVMFLPWVRGKLNRILERVAVTTATTATEEDEEQTGL